MGLNNEILEKVKDLIEEAVKKLKSDDKLLAEFKKDPVKVLEDIFKIDLPDEQVKAVVDGIKAKLDVDDLKDALGNVGDKLKGLGGLFGKK